MPTKTDYILIGVGVLAAVILAAYSPGVVKSMAGSISHISPSYSRSFRKGNMPGFDTLSALSNESTLYSLGNTANEINATKGCKCGSKSMSLESIEGIDLNLLKLARQKGF